MKLETFLDKYGSTMGYLETIFLKIGPAVPSHLTFCLSGRKWLIFVICVQNIWKYHFYKKEIKHWLFSLV